MLYDLVCCIATSAQACMTRKQRHPFPKRRFASACFTNGPLTSLLLVKRKQ